MDSEQERIIRDSLQSTREALIGVKHAVEALLIRVNKLECDVNIDRDNASEMRSNAIRTEEQLKVIQGSQDRMSIDLRSIRNSVLAALIGASILGLAGLAVTGLNYQVLNNSQNYINSNKGK
jgi:hypothetical protein